MDFFVGDGILATKKCRQKLMNLQHSYIGYKEQVRQTGEGFIKSLTFLMNLRIYILGDKHKSNPTFVLDWKHIQSNKKSSKEVRIEALSMLSTSQFNSPKKNKFQSLKNCLPHKPFYQQKKI